MKIVNKAAMSLGDYDVVVDGVVDDLQPWDRVNDTLRVHGMPQPAEQDGLAAIRVALATADAGSTGLASVAGRLILLKGTKIRFIRPFSRPSDRDLFIENLTLPSNVRVTEARKLDVGDVILDPAIPFFNADQCKHYRTLTRVEFVVGPNAQEAHVALWFKEIEANSGNPVARVLPTTRVVIHNDSPSLKVLLR